MWGQSPGKLLHHRLTEIIEGTYRDSLPPSPEEAFDILLDAVTAYLGYAARDMFTTRFHFTDVALLHERTVGVEYDMLRQIVGTVISLQHFPYASDVVTCLYPKGEMSDVKWQLNFKSPFTAKEVVRRLSEGETNVHEIFSFFSSSLEGKSLGGWFFEPLAHRAIAGGLNQPLYRLTLQNSDPASFALDDSLIFSADFLKIK